MRKARIAVVLLLGILLVSGFACGGGGGGGIAPTPSLTVSTTFYHDEVLPGPYPASFHEPMVIGTVPPSTVGSVTLGPYGQAGEWEDITLVWVMEGETVDILVEANNSIFFQLRRPGDAMFDVAFEKTDGGTSGVGFEDVGLCQYYGFFYENVASSIQGEFKSSTAMRVVAWDAGFLTLEFKNFSLDEVEITYSVWDGWWY